MPFGWAGWPSLSLPSLPDLSAIAPSFLTAQWQRRLLIYLVRRSLAGILLLPQDDIEQSTFLNGDLSQGKVELNAVQLDVESINSKIADGLKEHGVQAALRTGSVGRIQVVLGYDTEGGDGNDNGSQNASEGSKPGPASNLSITDRLLSAPIRVLVSDLQLAIVLKPAARDEKGKAAVFSQEADLISSILHVAEEYLHDTDVETYTSITQDEDEPFAGIPGAFASMSTASPQAEQEQVGLIAAVIQRVIARLQIEVSNVRLRVSLQEQADQPMQDLKMHVANVKSLATSEVLTTGPATTRTLSLARPEVWVRRSSAADEDEKATNVPPTYDTNLHHTPDSEDDLAMSMAIADLRDSAASIATEKPPGQNEDHAGSSSEDDEVFYSVYDPARSKAHLSPVEPKTGLNPASGVTADADAGQDGWVQILGLIEEDLSDAPAELCVRLVESLGEAASHTGRKISFSAPSVALCVPIELLQGINTWISQLTPVPAAHKEEPQRISPSPGHLLLHATVESASLLVHCNSRNISLKQLAGKQQSPNSIMLQLDRLQAASQPSTGNGKLAVGGFAFHINGATRRALQLEPEPGIAWAYDPKQLRLDQSVHLADPGQVKQGSSGKRPIPKSAAAKCKVPLLKDAAAVQAAPTGVSVVLQPMYLRADLGDVDGLTAILQSVAALGGSLSGAKPAEPPPSSETSKMPVTLESGCIRLSLRCPNPSAHILRAGLFTWDVWDLRIVSDSRGPPDSGDRKARFEKPTIRQGGGPSLQISQIHAFQHAEDAGKALPYLACRTGEGQAAVSLTHLEGSLDIKVHEVAVSLAKGAFDGLQYLADDIGQTLSSLQIGAHAKTSDELRPTSLLRLSLTVIKSTVDLILSEDHASSNRVLRLETSGLVITTIPKASPSHNGSTIEICCQTAQGHLIGSSSTRLLFCELAGLSDNPLLLVNLRSEINQTTGGKLLYVDAQLERILVEVTSDFAFIEALAQLAKTPPGAFENVEPGELTEIKLRLRDSCIRLLAVKQSSALAVHIKGLDYSTTLRPTSSVTESVLIVSRADLWMADDPLSISDVSIPLKSLEYAHLAAIDNCLVNISQAQNLTMEIVGAKGHVYACPDTLQVLGSHLANFSPPPPPKAKQKLQQAADLSSSVLLQRPTLLAGDDDFFAVTKHISASNPGRVVASDDDVQVTVRGTGRIPLLENWTTVKSRTKTSSSSQATDVQFSMRDSSVTISLYEGYDFERTRKQVRQTVKATRRKLEKIRQLLAEGQMPEETVEEATDLLLQSVFLPPRQPSPSSSDNVVEPMDTIDRIIAFDDELDKEDAEAASQEWEELPDRPPHMRRTISSQLPVKRGVGRLHRPRHSALDIHLESFGVDFRSFGREAGLVSSTKLDIGDLSIVDNMTTSTWHKFLTKLRPRDGGLLRPTGASMAQIRLKMLQPKSSENAEADLKVKLSPLRLHVDQDALDFLKAFAVFKMASRVADLAAVLPQADPPDEGSGGFVQRVEIFPIKIKLDYKPKRVDYRALQQGRTIEAMNFFHFEASEMTLRHLVLTGVPSWEKVGDMCQDIWTPDVKSNQLADFLAGINPVRSVVNVGTGVADLVLLPVQQYQKDGRLGRGVQKGTTKFAKTTALEAVKLGARLASGTQVVLEKAEHLLGARPLAEIPGRSPEDLLAEALAEENDGLDNEPSALGRQEALSKFSSQPRNAREGMQSAYRSLSGNVRSAAETILAVPIEVYERSSEGPVRAVVRAVPVAVLRSGIGASQAVREALLGLRNQMDPGAREEIQDKYKRPAPGS